MPKFEFKFNPDQDYQLEAINSVIRLFEGLPRHTSEFALGDGIVPNLPAFETLSHSWLFDNLRRVQDDNREKGIPVEPSMFLDLDQGLVLEGVGNEPWPYPSFTIEMETGTGKTYVYLRTILELRKHYGFRKFIIVVPSIAIYEGVVKHFEITRAHFRALYSNEPVHLSRYEGSRLSTLRSFASLSFVEILIATIDSFNKKSNVIYRPSEQLPGDRLPYQYIQETRPILILDEPQNMESETARAALRTLHPLFALRYSATHRTTPNPVYCLTPFDAFRRGLVKRIQVDAVTDRDDFNRPFLELRSIDRRGAITATVRCYVSDKGHTRTADVVLHHGDDLFAKTRRDEHKSGYRVANIHAGEGYVEFENALKLHLAETIGPSRPDIFRAQIERTVLRHLEWQETLLDRGIKVLSLFFIDRVANYTSDDGIIRRLFDEAFDRLKVHYPHFRDRQASEVRNAYFAHQKRRGSDAEVAVDTSSSTKAEREAEKAAFQLIMRDKERLLSLDEPVAFIFAHSALKEGWDNPNVFQICTLNQTVSTMKKRQEIGRGLRLAVEATTGERIFDEEVNVLTVVANESYRGYVSALQTEYVQDGQAAPLPPTRAGTTTAVRNDTLFADTRFQDFWNRLSQRTSYRINIDTPVLEDACVERLNNAEFPTQHIVIERGTYIVTKFSLELLSVTGRRAKMKFIIVDTLDNESSHTGTYEVGFDLSEIHHDERLRGFKVQSIETSPSPVVHFQNGQRLELLRPLQWDTEAGQAATERVVVAPDRTYPVFNLLDRAARETNLTRPTINAIFRRMSDRKKAHLLSNPEGFASVFITTIQNALADHVVERIEFFVDQGATAYNIAELFPPRRDFPQKELVAAGPAGLYDQVQTDSGVEVDFVRAQLKPDDRVICYFKFPPKFKVDLPKIVGNYNPDWGILRFDDQGRIVLQLIRETKYHTNLAHLRFPHEKRKVLAAEKHFDAIGIDYGVITAKTVAWWRRSDTRPIPLPVPPTDREPSGGTRP